MFGGDLWQECIALLDENDDLCDRLLTCGIRLATNDRDYRKALKVAELQMHADGYPVSIIRDVCRGHDDVAELCYLRDCSEAVYKSTNEKINNNKLRVRLYENQTGREWGQAGVNTL